MGSKEVEQCCGGKHCPLEHKPKLWSILICTLTEREQKFNVLRNQLQFYINQNKLNNDIEILYLIDSFYAKDKMSIGEKRNKLVESSNGEYICFIDDDDKISPGYIPLIYKALQQKPDVVGISGIMTTNGVRPKRFVHSLAYTSYYEQAGVYYRPPNHLNPMRKELITKFRFPEQNHGEDTDWAMQICKAKILKKEVYLNTAIYFYQYYTKPIYQH